MDMSGWSRPNAIMKNSMQQRDYLFLGPIVSSFTQYFSLRSSIPGVKREKYKTQFYVNLRNTQVGELFLKYRSSEQYLQKQLRNLEPL